MTNRNRRIIRRRMLTLLVIVLVLGFTAYLFGGNYSTLYGLDQQKIEITEKIEEQKIRSNQLDEQVKQIGSKSYVEFVARKYLGLYYPDEVIVVPATE